MFQTLLADRFQLKLHRETKELPIYALLVGKNGPKLKPAESQEGPNGRMMMRPGHFEGSKFAMSSLADMLSRFVSRPVVDMTELKGIFDFTLNFAPDENMRMMGGMPPPPGVHPEGGGEGRSPNANADSPTLFVALQEQLGLKLEARKGPLEILVIDHAEKVPTEN